MVSCLLLPLLACDPGRPSLGERITPVPPSADTAEPLRPPHPIEAGELEGDTRWTAEQGPYQVHGAVIVPAGSRLTVTEGTRIVFAAGANLTIRGELIAAGTATRPIVMTSDPQAPPAPDLHPSLPPGPPRWGGVQFVDSTSSHNLLSHVTIHDAQTTQGAVGLIRSEAVLQGLSITGTRLRMIYTDTSSLILRDSVLPTMLGPDDSATLLGLNNDTEYVKGVGGIPEGGHYRIEGNVFGSNKGHNDVIDVNGNKWPAEVVQIRGNLFTGGGDEAIDGGGDLLLDGNTFLAFVKDADNHGSGDSNCTSTGDTASTLMVATRNLYLGVDRVANLKRRSFGYFEHNTVVGISPSRPSLPGDNPPRILESAAIDLLIPDPRRPNTAPPRDPAGIGAYLEGNVFVDVPERIFGNPDQDPPHADHVSWLEVHRTLVERQQLLANADHRHGRAFDYLVGTPRFVDPGSGDYRLAPGSIGAGAGRHGLDLGAAVPAGATVCCAPDPSSGPWLAVEVGGPGIFSFVYRVDGGTWSDELTIGDPRDHERGPVRRAVPLRLGPLDPGVHTLEVRGRDFAGVLQPEDNPTRLSWLVAAPGPPPGQR